MGTAIKHSVPDWAKTVICNFWHLGTLSSALSARVPEYEKLQMTVLAQSSTGCFIAVPMWQKWTDIKGLNWSNKCESTDVTTVSTKQRRWCTVSRVTISQCYTVIITLRLNPIDCSSAVSASACSGTSCHWIAGQTPASDAHTASQLGNAPTRHRQSTSIERLLVGRQNVGHQSVSSQWTASPQARASRWFGWRPVFRRSRCPVRLECQIHIPKQQPSIIQLTSNISKIYVTEL